MTDARPKRLAVARAGEDHVFHPGAAQALGRLLAEHPTDGVAQVRLPAPVRTHDGRNTRAVKAHLGPVAERLKSLDFNAFEFQQAALPRDKLDIGA